MKRSPEYKEGMRDAKHDIKILGLEMAIISADIIQACIEFDGGCDWSRGYVNHVNRIRHKKAETL